MNFENTFWILTSLPWVAIFIAIKLRQKQKIEEAQLPPGPRRLPVLGNLHQLISNEAHISFAKLANEHGPLMTIWLGTMRTIIISSSAVAREMFKNHDKVFAGRKVYQAVTGYHGNEGSLITAHYGPEWRTLRKLCTSEIFVSNRIQAMAQVRNRCIDRTVQFIEDASDLGTKPIELAKFFTIMTFNLMGNLMFSKDLLDHKSVRGSSFFFHAGRIMELAGKPNVADYWPVLRWVDPQRLRKQTQYHVAEAYKIAGEMLKERIDEMTKMSSLDFERKKDYLNVLMEYREDGGDGPPKFSSRIINAIVLEMFIAGTDTTTTTMEWVMAELVRNQRCLKKVKEELATVIGAGRKVVDADLDKLTYLNVVIKETLRLHPALPFLVPHRAMETCKMLGFLIPKDTQILVNLWALGRDPKTWKDPLEFKPERFLDPNVPDFKGRHFEFLPFGSGRRMCPAVPLVSRVMPLAIGSLLNVFDWVLPDELNPEELDMGEKISITLKKKIPLRAIPVPVKV